MTTDIFSPFSGSKRQVTHANNNDPRQRITKYPKRNTRLHIRRSFSPLMLFFVFNIILCFTGSFAWGADSSTTSTTVRETNTKTIASVKPTGTGVDEDDEDDDDDEEGISVQGTDDLPTPFDTSIGKTFLTSTCPAFFNMFLNDADFQDCLPLSAMLQNSKSFFEITKKSGFATTRVLDVSCNINYPLCASKMEYYGREIKTPERCGTEFAKKDQLVIQAYAAFISYPTLFSAGCLKSDSGSYCYVDAVTNVTNPDDPHIYFLPLGLKLPGGSRPTCSSCTQETMNIYLKDAGNSSLPLSDTYLPAAHQLNMACGPDFINTNVISLSSSATQRASFSMASLLTATILLAIMFTT